MKKLTTYLTILTLAITLFLSFSDYALARKKVLVGGATVGTTP